MNSLYKKNELTFSFMWIILYVVLSSVADNLSVSLGIEKVVTAPMCILLSIFLWMWIKKNGLSEKCGFCRFKGDIGKYLYFIPLVIISTCNLWNGVTINFPVMELVLYVLNMLCAGFLEEVIFRGFLFNALCGKDLKQAILISSLTFGIGHIVNLLNGAEVFATLLQLCYATAIGFLFTIIFYKGKSLIPCIVSHSIFNSLSAFGIEGSRTFHIVVMIILAILSVAYAIWIWKKMSEDPK